MAPSITKKTHTSLRCLSCAGFLVFWLGIFSGVGVHVFGDAGMLGGYIPHLKIVLPIALLGLLVMGVASVLEGKSERFTVVQSGLFLLILLIVGVLLLVSVEPMVSVMHWFLWALAMFSVVVGARVYPEKSWQWVAVLLGIIGSFALLLLTPELAQDSSLLPVSAGFMALLLVLRPYFSLAPALLLALLWIFCQTYNGLFITVLTVIFATLFLINPTKLSKENKRMAGLSALFLLVLLGFYSALGQVTWAIPNGQVMWNSLSEMILGTGQGTYYYVLKDAAAVLPSSSFVHLLSEMGIVGTLLYIALPWLLVTQKRTRILALFLTLSLLFTSAFYATESGLLLYIILSLNLRALE